MELIEVVARFDLQGKITPLRFTWQGQKYAVAATGRRWQDEAGLHILVMAPGEHVYELVYVAGEARWYLKQISSHNLVA